MSLVQTLQNFRPSGRLLMKLGWIGVDIGSSAIKIAQLERGGGRFQIARSLIIPAPEDGCFDRHSIECGSVAQEIRSAMAMHSGFVGTQAACVVSMAHCELRTVMGPIGSEEQQREVVAVELNKDGGDEPREFDFWNGAGSEQDEARGTQQVHVVSLARGLADAVGTALLDARLNCSVLDTLPLCALRALELNSAARSGDTENSRYRLILDWGWSAATVAVVYEGRPVLARCLRNCGLAQFVESVANRLQLSRRQTYALLMNHGLPSQPRSSKSSELSELLLEHAASVIHGVTHELLETFEFARSKLLDPLKTSLIVCGGGGDIPGLKEYLATTLHMPVGRWSMPRSAPSPNQPVSILSNAVALSALAWES